jgi:uncharacterized lipoprotein YmbA
MSYRDGAGSASQKPMQPRKSSVIGWRTPCRRLAAAGALLTLAACASSPPTHFYTLTGGGNASGSAAPAVVNAGSQAYASPLLIEVLPAGVPPQLQRPQMVLDTGPGQVDVLEQRRWSQPLGDEIGQALSGDLTHALPAVDVYRLTHEPTQTVYRVTVNVQRFESVLGNHASLEAVWSVTRLPQSLTLTCRSALSAPAGDGYDALVASHRQVLAGLALQIGIAVRSLQRLPADSKTANLPACPADR